MKRRITIPWTRKDSSDGAVYRLFRRVPPPVAALVALAIYFAFLLLLTAQIDSGGGLSTLGGGANHSPFDMPMPAATTPFENDGAPIEIPVQMDGNKGFLRLRALGPGLSDR